MAILRGLNLYIVHIFTLLNNTYFATIGIDLISIAKKREK